MAVGLDDGSAGGIEARDNVWPDGILGIYHSSGPDAVSSGLSGTLNSPRLCPGSETCIGQFIKVAGVIVGSSNVGTVITAL